MEARAPSNKKLTRSERLKKCTFPSSNNIPENFLDTGLTFDIMEEAGEVDGIILDLAAVKKWQRDKIAEARKKYPPPTDEEIRQISQVNAFTRNPFITYIFLKDLDKQIEAWVCEQEQIQELFEKIEKEKKQKEENLKKLNELEPFIEQKLNSLNLQLQATQDEEDAERLIKEIADILHKQEKLPDKKNKITQGGRYYVDPDVINEKIYNLCNKLNIPNLTEDEKTKATKKLQFWHGQLEAWHNRTHLFLGRRRPATHFFGLQSILHSQTNEGSPTPALGKNTED
jgi:DNA repair exonuclease SbcCD ATPase subunit